MIVQTMCKQCANNVQTDMKGAMLALKREASAFQRTAPQVKMLQTVLNQWYTDEEWNEHDGTQDPSPNCSLEDPVITHLMSNWTSDVKKLKLLKSWLKHILANKNIKPSKSFRPGVELVRDVTRWWFGTVATY